MKKNAFLLFFLCISTSILSAAVTSLAISSDPFIQAGLSAEIPLLSTVDEYTKVVTNGGVVFVIVYEPGVYPCAQMIDLYAQMKQAASFKMFLYRRYAHQSIGQLEHPSQLPTLYVYRNGTMDAKLEGIKTSQELMNFVRKYR